jgi:NADH dehydrogenase
LVNDVHDPAALEQLVAGSDAVISLAGILHESSTGESARVLPNCRARLSMPAASAACGACCTCRLEGGARRRANTCTKAGGEQRIRVAQASGMRTTIFRPSVIRPRRPLPESFARLANALPSSRWHA